MNDTDVLELRKDILTPERYIAAGAKKTTGEWKSFFPNMRFDLDWREWFISLNNQPDGSTTDLARHVVNQVFAKRNLHSIIYKEAAVEAIERYLSRIGG